MIEKLFLAGADLFRLNFSHGSQEQKKELLMTIREIEEKYSHPIGILGDLQGPKLRVSYWDRNCFVKLLNHQIASSPYNFFSIVQVGEFSNPNGEMLELGQTFRFDLDEGKSILEKTRTYCFSPLI